MSDELRLKLSLNNKEKLMKTYEYLYYKYRGLVFFIVAKYVNSKDMIEEIVDDTFLELFNNPKNIKSSIKGFLSYEAKGKAIRYLKIIEKIDNLDDANTFSYEFSYDEYNKILENLKEHLSDDEFVIFYYHLIDDMTFKEISKRISKKESTVKSIYYNTIFKAKKILEDK